MMPTSRRAAMAAAALLLASCAGFGAPPALPQLRLSPASLGRTLVLQQRITVTASGRSRTLELALEADSQAVRIAVFELGHTIARFEWDGAELTQERAPGWPEVVSGPRILGDLQLVHWPAQTLQAALPPGWSLFEAAGARSLRQGGRSWVEIRYPREGVAELSNLADRYELRIESRVGASS